MLSLANLLTVITLLNLWFFGFPLFLIITIEDGSCGLKLALISTRRLNKAPYSYALSTYLSQGIPLYRLSILGAKTTVIRVLI